MMDLDGRVYCDGCWSVAAEDPEPQTNEDGAWLCPYCTQARLFRVPVADRG